MVVGGGGEGRGARACFGFGGVRGEVLWSYVVVPCS